MEERVRVCGLDCFLVMVCVFGLVTACGGVKAIERACSVMGR